MEAKEETHQETERILGIFRFLSGEDDTGAEGSTHFFRRLLREQYRTQGSEQPYQYRKPCGAGDKKYGSFPPSEYVKSKRPQDACQ